MDTEELGKRRFVLLLKQLQEELGRGWQPIAAQKLGLSVSLISSISLGNKQAGLKSIRAAVDRLPISEAFFFDRTIGEKPNYRDYVGQRRPSANAQIGAIAVADMSRTSQSFVDHGDAPTPELSTWDLFLYSDAAFRASKAAITYAENRKNHDGTITVAQLAEAVRGFDAGTKAIKDPIVAPTPIRRGATFLKPGKR